MSESRRLAGAAAPARAGDAGFTLVEALVAFVVLALLLSVLFRGVVGLRAAAIAFDTRTHAELVARALLDETLALRSAKTGVTSGWRDGRHWTMTSTPLDLASQIPAPPSDASGPGGSNANPPPPGGGADGPAKRPLWSPRRIIIKVDTDGSPIEVVTILLARVS